MASTRETNGSKAALQNSTSILRKWPCALALCAGPPIEPTTRERHRIYCNTPYTWHCIYCLPAPPGSVPCVVLPVWVIVACPSDKLRRDLLYCSILSQNNTCPLCMTKGGGRGFSGRDSQVGELTRVGTREAKEYSVRCKTEGNFFLLLFFFGHSGGSVVSWDFLASEHGYAVEKQDGVIPMGQGLSRCMPAAAEDTPIFLPQQTHFHPHSQSSHSSASTSSPSVRRCATALGRSATHNLP